jgi:hypothetical protein
MDTVVWDTINGAEVGRVPDARGQAHHITWGPGNLLVVETRSGAVLWNVPAGTQITLDVPFHTTRLRNFSRLRWDTEHNQLIGDLAVGGRKVFDLVSAQEVALSPAAQYTANQRTPSPERAVLIGGKLYDCSDLEFVYLVPERQIVIRAENSPYHSSETLAVLENGIDIVDVIYSRYDSTFRYAPDCRYASIVLRKPGNRFETVIYDLSELRRIASFGDAYLVKHPFEWSPDSRHALIASKDGVFLWNVATDTRTLLTENVYVGWHDGTSWLEPDTLGYHSQSPRHHACR